MKAKAEMKSASHGRHLVLSLAVSVLSLAGALVMYDRLASLGRFAPRPVRPGGPTEPLPAHEHGLPVFRRGPAGQPRK